MLPTASYWLTKKVHGLMALLQLHAVISIVAVAYCDGKVVTDIDLCNKLRFDMIHA